MDDIYSGDEYDFELSDNEEMWSEIDDDDDDDNGLPSPIVGNELLVGSDGEGRDEDVGEESDLDDGFPAVQERGTAVNRGGT